MLGLKSAEISGTSASRSCPEYGNPSLSSVPVFGVSQDGSSGLEGIVDGFSEDEAGFLNKEVKSTGGVTELEGNVEAMPDVSVRGLF